MAQTTEPQAFSRLDQFTLPWNTQIPPSTTTFVHHLISSRASQHPSWPAICAHDGNFTYAELESFSTRLATHIMTAYSIGPETIIPLFFEKSAWTAISMLAVIKAGAAFVALDVTQPTSRLSSIISQTDANFALSSTTCHSLASSLVGTVFPVDFTTLFNTPIPTTPAFLPSPTLENAAYVIFTSGSTGTPKGVVLEHRQLSTFCALAGDRLGYGKGQRVFQFSTHVFDPLIMEVFTTLVYGGTVCIPSEWQRKNALAETMRQMGVTQVFFTPSLLSSIDIKDVPTLNTLIVGGESVPPSLVEEWKGRVRLVLVYGPTECTIVCVTVEASRDVCVPGEIGLPMGVRTWIVKEGDVETLAEFGEVGELVVEGPLVGRGYLKNPERNAVTWIRKPAWMSASEPSTRFYRTGDLARYLDDGRLVYAGRVDTQVKIRGQRLELTEVEKHIHDSLKSIEEVRAEQVIVLAASPAGLESKHLVAFLRLHAEISLGHLQLNDESDQKPTLNTSQEERAAFSRIVSTLMESLTAALPSYALPSAFAPLLDVPKNLSGKTDLRKLAAAVGKLSLKQLKTFSSHTDQEPTDDARSAPPLTKDELTFQRLFGSVLGHPVSDIRPTDDFLTLGGDSVAAIKLVAAARHESFDLSLETVYRYPQLRDMVANTTRIEASGVGDNADPFTLLGEYDLDDVIYQAGRRCSVLRADIEDIYPCSAMQAGLMASSLKARGAYVMQLVYQLPSSVDIYRLMAAWDRVVKRTPALRTRFFAYKSDFLQVVVRSAPEWNILSGDLEEFLAHQKEMGGNTEFGEPLSRVAIFREKRTETPYLIWTVHHSVVDAWSASIVTADVEREYQGGVKESESLDRSFQRFIRHIRQQDEQRAREFWSRQLIDASATTFPRLPHQNYTPHATAVLEREIPHFGREGTFSSVLVQAAWALLLGIYTGTADVVLGVTSNGRTAPVPGIDLVTGPTLTTVPFRVQYDPSQTLGDLLGHVQDQYFSVLPFEQYGLQNIQRLSDSARSSCDIQSLLVVQSPNSLGNKGDAQLLRPHRTELAVSNNLMLECNLSDRDQPSSLRATFDPDVISDVEVGRLLCQLDHLIHRVSCAGLNTSIAELQGAGGDDIAQILGWNGTRHDFVEACVHDLVKEQTGSSLSAPAICAWDGDMSYETLDTYSGRLASLLADQYGVRVGKVVAVSFEKSKWAVVTMLAVLRAGGACVPLDPKSRLERLRVVLHELGNASADLILTNSSHPNALLALGSRVLTVDQTLIEELDLAEPARTVASVTPSDPAFVVFTSGSTGVPKGIVIEHRNFCSSAKAHGAFIGLNEQSRVFQFAAYTFDISIGDMFATLIHGGCICIPSESDRMNDVVGAIQTLGANHVSLTTTVASSLRPGDVPRLRTLIVAGEPLTKDLVETWADAVMLINMYGPAEATVYCTGKRGLGKTDSPSNIGKGVGATTWLVDQRDHHRLVPIGGIGEIVIEGPTVARGYLNVNAPNQGFLQEPAWSKLIPTTKERCFYRTGDLASYNPDGSLFLIGRNDGQAKLHGQRLEIGEVEYRLREVLAEKGHETKVAASVVTFGSGSKVLAAFLGVREGASANGTDSGSDGLLDSSTSGLTRFRELVQDLEARLPNILPSYMVPSVYVPLRSIPVSTSGKVNRKELQRVVKGISLDQLSRLRASRVKKIAQKAPESTMQRQMHSLWAKLLGTEDIHLEDNFFRLGGDSVMAMRLVAMARSLGLRLTVHDIFQNPSLAGVSSIIHDEKMSARHTAGLQPFSLLQDTEVEALRVLAQTQCRASRADIEDIYPSTFLQRRMFLGQKRQESDARDYQAQLAFALPANIDIPRFRSAWDSVVRRHASLRTRYIQDPKSSKVFQVVMVHGSEWADSALDEYLRKDRFDNMTAGKPLVRLAIARSAVGDHFFVLTILHAIYDAFSLDLIFKEAEETYLRGAPPTFPPASMNQYIRYILSADKPAAVKFWTSYLSGTDTKPLHRPGAPFPQVTDRGIIFPAPSIRDPSIKLSTVIETTVGLVLAHHIGCRDVILRSIRLGRGGPVDRLEEIVGPTITVLPLRVRLDSSQRACDLLRLAQDLQSEMMRHEHVGFFELRDSAEYGVEVEEALRHSYHVNVNPNPMGGLGRKLGLELRQTAMRNADPFGVYADMVEGGNLDLKVRSADEYVPGEVAEEIVGRIRTVMERLAVVGADDKLTVGEILG